MARPQYREQERAWRHRNPDKVVAASARHYAALKKNPAAYAARMALQRTRYLANKYRITQADFEALLAKQNGRCGICRIKLLMRGGREVSARACVDHDHESGEVRGLLCRTCNRGLGFLGDSVAALQSAIGYLKGE